MPRQDDNRQPAALVDLGFKVDPALRRRFRVEAAQRGITMRTLFELSFRLYLAQQAALRPDDVKF